MILKECRDLLDSRCLDEKFRDNVALSKKVNKFIYRIIYRIGSFFFVKTLGTVIVLNRISVSFIFSIHIFAYFVLFLLII